MGRISLVYGLLLLFILFILLPIPSLGQVKKAKQTEINTNASNVTNINTQSSITQELKQEGLLSSPTEVESIQPKPQEGIEYISVYSKEKGFKIYLETGGGPLVSGGVIWRFNPIFGIGIGGGYTPLPYRNFGPLIDLKAEVIPVYFFIAGDELKMNILAGVRGVMFFGSMTYYTGIDVGSEFLIKRFQYLIPGIHAYLYLAGSKIIPQFSFQLRFSI